MPEDDRLDVKFATGDPDPPPLFVASDEMGSVKMAGFADEQPIRIRPDELAEIRWSRKEKKWTITLHTKPSNALREAIRTGQI